MGFFERAQERWVAGKRERGLPLDSAFQGDPRIEFQEEMLDGANYADEMWRRGMIQDEVRLRVKGMLRELYDMAERAREEEADG